MQEKKRKFNRKHCQTLVRKSYKNKFGDKFVLFGKHAFNWGVMTQKRDGTMKAISFEGGRKAAENHYRLLINQYK